MKLGMLYIKRSQSRYKSIQSSFITSRGISRLLFHNTTRISTFISHVYFYGNIFIWVAE